MAVFLLINMFDFVKSEKFNFYSQIVSRGEIKIYFHKNKFEKALPESCKLSGLNMKRIIIYDYGECEVRDLDFKL